MARITPERAELIWEALQLREFGCTQQQIADCLGVPRTTILRWLYNFGQSMPAKMDNSPKDVHILGLPLSASPITLYPCKYEEANLPGDFFDLILTDPPYLASGNNISRNNQRDLQRDFGEWDKTPQDKYNELVAIWTNLMAKHLKDGGSLYLFTSHKQMHLWSTCLEASGLSYRGLIVWHRTNPAPQIRKTVWCPAYDFILYYSKGTPRTFRWIGQNEMHNVLSWPGDTFELQNVWLGAICGGNEREYHPTQKPRWLLEKLLWVSTQPPESQILDPFAGSGSTAFAAKRFLGRKATLIEPAPKYTGLIQSTAKDEFGCEVILKTP